MTTLNVRNWGQRAALAVLMLATVMALPAAAQRRDDEDRVCFYKDVQFQGQAWCYQPGDELPDLRDRRNEISSIRVFGRARAVVFDDRDFEGASDEFDTDVPDLSLRVLEGRRSWNDRIESVVVEFAGREARGRGRGRGRGNRDGDDRDDRQARDRICVFEDVNFRGRSQCWDAGEEEANLNKTNGWNDRIRSIRVFGRTGVDVFREADFRGARLRIDRDVADLGAMGFASQISSFRVR